MDKNTSTNTKSKYGKSLRAIGIILAFIFIAGGFSIWCYSVAVESGTLGFFFGLGCAVVGIVTYFICAALEEALDKFAKIEENTYSSWALLAKALDTLAKIEANTRNYDKSVVDVPVQPS
ncbi:MAG: hypothetical protein LBM98_10385 [Oscillospiraceae bacterium]|jgi:hypothetical protein|nr:hypothetical protein [Oscillospiraceae bacterium]